MVQGMWTLIHLGICAGERRVQLSSSRAKDTLQKSNQMDWQAWDGQDARLAWEDSAKK